MAEKGTKLISVGVETGWIQRREIGAGAEAGGLLIEASSVTKFAGQVGLHSVGEQNLPPQMSLWPADYFELKKMKTSKTQEILTFL